MSSNPQARTFFVVTLKIVGAVQKPAANSGPAGRPPPVSRGAPSAMVVAMYADTLSNCILQMLGPISTPSENGPPTTMVVVLRI